MNPTVPENKKVSPFLVFYLISSMQFGVGALGFQRTLSKAAGYDAWVSILITGICIQILLWMMYKMLKTTNGDIVSIHIFVFGNKIGKYINIIFMIYFCLLAITVLRNYIEIIQVWMFPDLPVFGFTLVFLLLVIYVIYGGFRTVTGISFFSIVVPTYILFMFFFTIPFADFTNLLPVLDHSVKEILTGSRDMSLTVLGFESLLFFYPFIKDADKSRKWGHLALLATTFIYIFLAFITFSYFSKAQLEKNIWPTLTMWKIVQLPFIERFEYIGITNWLLIILPNVCIAIWCASRLGKRIFSIRQKTITPFLTVLCLVGVVFLKTRIQIDLITNITGKIGFYFNFVYIPILFFLVLIMKRVKNV